MESKDNYIVKRTRNGTGACFFYKNGTLHREAGPAIVTLSNREHFLQLGDEELYKEEHISTDFPDGYSYEYLQQEEIIDGHLAKFTTIPIFYLNGQPYTEEEFNKIKLTLELKNELNNELLSSTNSVKKAKV